MGQPSADALERGAQAPNPRNLMGPARPSRIARPLERSRNSIWLPTRRRATHFPGRLSEA